MPPTRPRPSGHRTPPSTFAGKGAFRLSLSLVLGLVTLPVATATATVPAAAQVPNADIAALEGLTMPERPETMARNEEGQITVRAYRLDQPLELDGALDEEIYQRIEPASGFTQWDPDRGEPATEDTRVWVFYDDENVYVSLRALSDRPEAIVANEMRRDHRNVWQNENIIVALDTFLDRRSAVFFQTNALGAVRDGLVIDENTRNFDWNTIWDVRSRRTDEGWTSEMAIPFESFQYEPRTDQIWGINVHRVVRSKNEFSILSPPPADFNSNGVFRMASAATLVGLEAPSAPSRVEVRPYAISTVNTDRPAGISNDVDADVGFDARYALTPSLNLDLTYNTDFAQVEVDEQQVNLSRFSLLFPEKRDFFLEGQSVFDFAGTGGGGPNQGPDPTPFLFFSRRIGFARGQPVPIDGGARLMGREGPVSMGALYIRTGEGERIPADPLDPDDGSSPGAPATDFAVARVKSDIFDRSSVGALATYRGPAISGGDRSVAGGIDASVSPTDNLWLTGYYARTETGGIRESDAVSYLARAQYDADRYGLRVERLAVGEGFNPEVGFLRRRDFDRSYLQARISRRPEDFLSIQRWSLVGSVDRYDSRDGVKETQTEQAGIQVEFLSSDQLSVDVTRNFEYLDQPFPVAGGGTVEPGTYRFNEVSARFQAGPHRWISGSLNARHGGFYGGARTRLAYQGRLEFGSRFAVEPRISHDWVELDDGSFEVTLLGARPTFTINPRNFLSALAQYNSASDAIETNVRWRWELEPGTILYVVYTDARVTERDPVLDVDGLVNRSVAVKFTRLLRF